MNFANVISLVALVISLASFVFSIYCNRLDRARIVTDSKFLPGWDDQEPKISISIVNAGRRPVVIRMWLGTDSRRGWVGTYFGGTRNSLRLTEHERYDLSITRDDLVGITPEDDVEFEDLWFEDTLGRRHRVKNAKENIMKLRAS